MMNFIFQIEFSNCQNKSWDWTILFHLICQINLSFQSTSLFSLTLLISLSQRKSEILNIFNIWLAKRIENIFCQEKAKNFPFSSTEFLCLKHRFPLFNLNKANFRQTLQNSQRMSIEITVQHGNANGLRMKVRYPIPQNLNKPKYLQLHS